jgi:hypothetical protein
MTPHRCNSVTRQSAQDLVAVTVVLHRWHRSYLQALAVEQGCTTSTILRALLDQALGPAALEEPEGPADATQPPDEAQEPGGRAVTLQPRLLRVLAAVADQRALPLSQLVSEILNAWLLAHIDASD